VSDTPRTDNEAWSEGSSVPELVTAELARKLERELTAAKEELAATKAEKRFYQESFATADSNAALLRTETQEQARLLGMSGEREADLRGEIERLRRRVEAADGLAEEAQILANILRANTDVHGRCLLERDMTIGLCAALFIFCVTEGKK